MAYRSISDLAIELADVAFQLRELYARREGAIREVFANTTYGSILAEGGSVEVDGWILTGRRVEGKDLSEQERRVYPRHPYAPAYYIKLHSKPAGEKP